jgi:hypothetical protein
MVASTSGEDDGSKDTSIPDGKVLPIDIFLENIFEPHVNPVGKVVLAEFFWDF